MILTFYESLKEFSFELGPESIDIDLACLNLATNFVSPVLKEIVTPLHTQEANLVEEVEDSLDFWSSPIIVLFNTGC